MAECLHCQINELVKKHLDNDDQVDVNDLVARIVESAAELIADAGPEDEQATMLAAAISHLGHAYLEKIGAYGEESQATH